MTTLSRIFELKYSEYNKNYNIQVKADFSHQESKLNTAKPEPVCISTDNLNIKEIVSEDINLLYKKLWGDAEVMEFYGEKKTRNYDEFKLKMEYFINIWRKKNPFSCFVVKNKENKLVGAVIFNDYNKTYTDYFYPHAAYLSYLSAVEFQGRGLAKEYIGAIVFGWSRYVLDNNYQLSCGSFDEILATCDTKNVKSIRILEDFGFNISDNRQKFGVKKIFYRLPIVLSRN